MMGNYEKIAVRDENGKLVTFRVVPTEALKQKKRFAREMTRQGAWMTESSMKQILDAYNEAFDKTYY